MTDQGRYRPKHGVPSDYVSKKQLDKATDRIERLLTARKESIERCETRLDNIVAQIRELVGADPVPLNLEVPAPSGDRQKARAEILKRKREALDRS